MIDEHGVWHDNVTCPECKHRHPKGWSCGYAQQLATAAKTDRAAQRAINEEVTVQEWLDAFIERAGFRYGWLELESSARMMARQAYEELK